MTPAPDQLREFARRYTDAWCSQDPARVAENYAPDGSLTINDGAPSVGRAAITEAVSAPLICGGGGRRRAARSAGLNRHCGVRTGPGGSGRGNGNRRRPTRSGRQAGATGDGS